MFVQAMRLIISNPFKVKVQLIATLVLALLAARAVGAESTEETIHFDIPAQRADRALTEFAQQAGLSVLFPFDRVTGVTANRLLGAYSAADGLRRLLDGTGLTGLLDKGGGLSVEVIDATGRGPEMNENRGVFAALLAALAAGGVPEHVAGQEEEGLLEEIVVTARKREESLQDVPVSISVIDSGLIAEAGIRDSYDLYENTPGISWEESLDRQGSRPTVRGVQTTAQNATRQKVSAFMDGFPVLGQQGGLQFVGVERVEVLRGPQSAAFGRSTFAGAINFVTRDPGEEFAGDLKLTATDLGRREFQVSVDGPINDAVGYTVDINLDRFDGPDEWVSSEGRRLGGRATDYVTAKLTFAPNERFDGFIRLLSTDISDGPPIQYFMTRAERDACSNFSIGRGRAANKYIRGEFDCVIAVPVGGYPQNLNPENDYRPGTPTHDLVQSYAALDAFSNLERDRVQARFNFNTQDHGTLELLASYSEDALARWYDGDASDAMAVVSMGRVLGVRNSYNTNGFDETYMEARWVSPEDRRLYWLVGASVYDYDSLSHVWTQWAGVVLGLEDEANRGNPFRAFLVNSDTVTNTGVFASLSYDVTDRTTVSLEGRFQRDEVTAIETFTRDSFVNTTDSFQPRVALAHSFSDRVSGYVQLSSGTNPANVNLGFVNPNIVASLRAAGAAGAVAFDETTFLRFDEEQLTNFEVGLKGTFFDNRLNLAAALYSMDWEDMILAYAFNWDGAWNDGSHSRGRIFRGNETGARTFINAGDGDLSGLEIEASYRFNAFWSMRAAIAMAKAEFARFCDAAAVTGLGLTPTDSIETGALTDCINVAGNDLVGQPDESLVLSPTFRSGTLPNSNWNWTARLDIRYASEEYVDAVNIMQLPATTIVNGSINFRNDAWTIRLYGNNLTDDKTPRRVGYPNDNAIGLAGPGRRNFRIQPRIPREIGLTLSFAF